MMGRVIRWDGGAGLSGNKVEQLLLCERADTTSMVDRVEYTVCQEQWRNTRSSLGWSQVCNVKLREWVGRYLVGS